MNTSVNISVANEFDNETQNVEIYELNAASHVINALVAGFTILLNIIVLVCLKTCRRKLPDAIWYQLLNLTVGDLLSGVCLGLLCLTLFTSVNTSRVACTTFMLLFVISQYATLLNVCILAIHRWKIIRRLTQPAVSVHRNVYSSLYSWMLSLLCHLPFLAFIPKRLQINGCFAPDIVDNWAAVVYNPLLGFLSLLVVNGIYCHAAKVLSRRHNREMDLGNENQSRTQVANIETNLDNNKSVQNRKRSIDFKGDENSPACSRRPSNQISTISNGDLAIDFELRIIESASASQTDVTSVNEYGEGFSVSGCQGDTVPRSVSMTTTGATSITADRFHEKRAIKLLLIALITVDIATLSYVVIFVGYIFGILTIDPNNVAAPDMQILALNSLFNPLIYSFQVTEIRTALKESVRAWVTRT